MLRTPVTLSIGTTTVIAPNRFVQMAAGPPPASVRERLRKGNSETDQKPQSKEELEWTMRVQARQLERCVGPITTTAGPVVQLSELPALLCKEGQLSVEELPEPDVTLLLATIERLREEAEARASTFRPQLLNARAAESGSAGQPLQLSPESTPRAAGG